MASISAHAAALGKMQDAGATCAPGPIANTSCRVVVVSCPDLKDLRAQLRVTEPVAGKALRGTVVLGSGGNGRGFYAAQPPVQSLVSELAGMGLRVVDRQWDGGWVTQEGGLKKEACRYATLQT